MKRFLIIILFFNFIMIGAQDIKMIFDKNTKFEDSPPPIILDTTVMRVQYRQSISNDTAKIIKKTENLMLLQVGNNISKYTDYYKLIGDSLMDVYLKEGLDINTIIGKTSKYTKGTSKENIFKNYPKEKITSTNYFSASNHLYEEPMPKINWELDSGELTISGYKCKKASTTLFGRKYIAWYAPDIPISNGPWKFSGLPGLILKVEDNKKQISFECIGIEKPRWVDKIYMSDRDYLKTSKKQFLKSYNQYRENPGAVLQSSGMIQGNVPANALKKRAYNPIELTE